MGVRPAGVKVEPAARRLKINYPEDVVLRWGPLDWLSAITPIDKGEPRCSICC
jgi:hypothetical protein